MRKDSAHKIQKNFGARIRHQRIQVGLSQEGLALRSGLDRTYIGGVERGERNISLVNIHRLASALGLNASEFFTNEK